MSWGALAFENYDQDLLQEAKHKGLSILARHGDFFVFAGPPQKLIWSKVDPSPIHEFQIESIKDAAQQLKQLGAFWWFGSQHHHRRAHLIQENLPRVKNLAYEFLELRSTAPIGFWTLIEENKILACHPASRFTNGEMKFQEDKTFPSTAYLKLWELFTAHKFSPKMGESAVDLGAFPGGWTEVLLRLGLDVTAVDRQPVNLKGKKFPGKLHIVTGDAFSYKPINQVDWVFSDLIAESEKLKTLAKEWVHEKRAKNFVFTIKFKGQSRPDFVEDLLKIPGSNAVHLSHNKHEITWFNVDFQKYRLE